MRAFCIQQWRLITLLVVAVLWIVAFPMWSAWVSKFPLNAVISLSPVSPVQERIEIRIPERYLVFLKFERDGIEFEQLRKLFGDAGPCLPNTKCSKGVPVPIRWSLKHGESGATISSGEVESINSGGWSAPYVYRFVDYIQVQPGEYVFEAEVVRPVPELAHIRTHIAIERYVKTWTTWQMELVWWGSGGYVFLAWPAAVYAFVRLLWRAGQIFRSKARSV